jgi:hypothetical protein
MNAAKNQKRVLALDVRPSHFGYVVFEGPEELLDWGVRGFRDGVNAVRVPAPKKLAALLDEFAPGAIVLKDRKKSKIAHALRRQARARRIGVKFVTLRAVKQSFAGHAKNKYEIASTLATHFPDLAWRLPPKRKIWQSEDYRMNIFDAAALGAAYFARYASRVPPVPPGNIIPS